MIFLDITALIVRWDNRPIIISSGFVRLFRTCLFLLDLFVSSGVGCVGIGQKNPGLPAEESTPPYHDDVDPLPVLEPSCRMLLP